MNKALLIKLGWRLLRDPNAPWSKTLLSKYGRGCKGLDPFEHKQGASHVWRGIVNSFLAVQGVNWRFGNGGKNKFWLDVWAHESPYWSLQEVLYQRRFWDRRSMIFGRLGGVGLVQFWLLTSLKYSDALAGFVVSEEEGRDDEVTWEEEGNGVFTVKKPYDKLCATTSEVKWLGWNKI